MHYKEIRRNVYVICRECTAPIIITTMTPALVSVHVLVELVRLERQSEAVSRKACGFFCGKGGEEALEGVGTDTPQLSVFAQVKF